MAEPLRSGRICASLAAATPVELQQRWGDLEGADMVEIRLDALTAPPAAGELRRLVRDAPVELLLTCRPAWEGGGWSGSETTRRELLEAGLAAGARWIDVELRAGWVAEAVAAAPEQVVVSRHWTEPRPDLTPALAAIRALRPAVAKLVAPVEAPDGAGPLLATGTTLRGEGIAATTFALGDAGRASRLLDLAAGGAWIYAATAGGDATAPGQWSARWLRQALAVARWRPEHDRYGLVGAPIDHSLSPVVFNAAFAADDRDALYLPLPGPELEPLLGLAERVGVRGLSVTMPFKQVAAAQARSLTPAAGAMGAANTLTREEGGWAGANTDGDAVVAVLAERIDLERASIAILGAGGAARAAAYALLEAGARVRILNRTVARGERVAAELGCDHGDPGWLRDGRVDSIVNATPVGMDRTARTPIPTAWLKGGELVLDMIYRPRWTPLLRQARERGCTVVSGLEMFLQQAAGQHAVWTGDAAPLDAMRVAAERALDAEESDG